LVVAATEHEVFDIFDIPFLKGDSEASFQSADGMVITEETARKYFGDEDPIGKVLHFKTIEMNGDFQITGVIKDWPTTSLFRFDCLITSPRGNLGMAWDRWDENPVYRHFETFVMLKDGQDARVFEKKLQDVIPRYMGPIAEVNNVYHLQPLLRRHLYSRSDYDLAIGGDIKQVYMLGAIAVFILVIACINFVNLATARSARRAREVGLRKVVGAYRQQLVGQFLSESILMAMVALLVAIALVELALPAFNGFMGQELSLVGNVYGWWMVWLIGLVVLVGVGAGVYPALYLSGSDPVLVMKGSFAPGSANAWMRKILVTFQFAISIIFLTATVVVNQQLDFIQNKNLGFDTERVVGMFIFWESRNVHQGGRGELRWRYRDVKRAFLRHPNIEAATGTRFKQGGYITIGTFEVEGKSEPWQMGVFDGDEDYVDFFGLKIVEGRDINVHDMDYENFQKNGPAYLINETAVKQLGWDKPIGKRLGETRWQKGRVVGVLKDFHLQSLHNPIRPVAIKANRGGMKILNLKLGPNDVPGTIAYMEEMWNRFLPERPFEFMFLDEELTQVRYEQEIRLRKMYTAFSGLAIFVACLGLFGLISFVVEQRTKEIGIRKTMGASVPSLFFLLARDFMKLILLANVIACPIVYYMMDGWLQDFAFRIDWSYGFFLLGGTLIFVIAVLTMSYQTLKAARANPVEALRTE
jgi:putative ABC transport system permease protein